MTTNTAIEIGWLRGPGFDGFFIVGIAAIGVASGFVVAWDNDLFLPILAADLWILGYHHVVATYTRLAFDAQSFAENKGLILYLLPAVAGAVVLLVLSAGLWLVPTIYLYWQWWHYTRQSEGISKAYIGKSRDKQLPNPRLARAALYSVPLTGILAVSHRSPPDFLYFPLRTLPVTESVVLIAAIITVAILGLWVLEQVKAYMAGRLAIPYVMYVTSHFIVYFFAYIYMEEINYGWLIVNIWHNAQYILFVWLYNNRRFSGGLDKTHQFLSTISQNGRFILYIATCLTISTFVYFLFTSFLSDALSTTFAMTATMTGLIIYQTINFHHYIVDSLIWKLRKKPIRDTLGLT